jgi:phosphohistidine phosphatase
MTVYLVRHAHAVDANEDAVRALSATGRAQAERLARFLKGSGAFRAAEFWHSPLVRARETAAIVAEELGGGIPLREVPGLEPDENPSIAAARLESVPHPVALFGHEPHLSSLASLLVKGSPWPPAFAMRKCAALALEREGSGRASGWTALWHVAPELLE